MSVSETCALPGQPTAAGSSQYIPLGGDGVNTPFAAYAINDMIATGDAGGGVLDSIVTFDTRYVALIGYIDIRLAMATPADASFRISVGGSAVPGPQLQGVLTSINADLGVNTLQTVWVPPAVLPPLIPGSDSSLSLRWDNVLASVSTLNVLMYLFQNTAAAHANSIGQMYFNRGSNGPGGI